MPGAGPHGAKTATLPTQGPTVGLLKRVESEFHRPFPVTVMTKQLKQNRVPSPGCTGYRPLVETPSFWSFGFLYEHSRHENNTSTTSSPGGAWSQPFGSGSIHSTPAFFRRSCARVQALRSRRRELQPRRWLKALQREYVYVLDW